MRIAEIRPYKRRVRGGQITVYDLTVDDTHLYRANGVLVSNSKRVGMLEVNSLLSAGGIEALNDVGNVRGQRNDDRWLSYMQGHTPQHTKVPYVFQKFVHQLQGSGINVVQRGPKINIMAMTAADIDKLAGDRVLKNADTVRFDKDMRPIPGGLFDPQLTGGHGGRQWSAIKLDEPMPSPVMEEPIRRILGLTQKQFEGVIDGSHDLPRFGTGPKALVDALGAVNLDRELQTVEGQFHSGRKTVRDEAARRWGYLKDAKRLGMHPGDWITGKVPVLPPVFRPVGTLGQSGIPLVSDPNYLYREVMAANNNLVEMKKELGHGGVGAERLALYHSFKAVTGLAEPIHPKLREKHVKGILASVFSSSPKFGVVQRKLLSHTVDNVGRGVITPNPDLDMDSVGVPEKLAYDMYSKFLVRRMVRRGLPIREALRHVKDKSELARSTLVEEMNNRPVYVSRAPVLHKYGFLALKPQLVTGHTVQMPPLITKGYGADFDGDAVQVHVPSTDAAVKEAYERLLPSRSLLSTADFKSPVHAPTQEYLAGLYVATRPAGKRRARVFRNRQDAIAAHKRGDIGINDPVEILEH